MENKTFYIPIDSISLPHYFGKAIILPAQYYDNKPADIQDQLNRYIILSKRRWIGSNDCAIEVIITPSELLNIHIIDDVKSILAYNNGIPISRVIAVHFRDKKQSEITQWNINSGTAFLPDRLIKIESGTYEGVNAEPFSIKDQPALQVIDLSDKAKRFDILMGGIAFLKTSSTQPGYFPADYFSVLSTFNNLIKSEYTKAVNSGKTKLNEKLPLIFTSKRSQLSPIQSLYFDDVTVATVEAAAEKVKFPIVKKYGMLELEKLASNKDLYYLALLATFGSNKTKNIQDLISSILSDKSLSEEDAEEIALIFGLNARYSGLRNAYNGKALPVKFKLETLLDAYTIESVFQYTFGSQKEIQRFSYLDASFTGFAAKRQDPTSDGYYILDTFVPVKKKKSLEEEYLEQFGPFYTEVRDIFERGALKGFQRMQQELNDRDRQINELKRQIQSAELSKRSNSAAPVNPGITHSENDSLEKMDFKDLKILAKNYKIPAKSVNASKNSLEGIKELITLIRNNKPLL